jgi:hypothetical protein
MEAIANDAPIGRVLDPCALALRIDLELEPADESLFTIRQDSMAAYSVACDQG